MYNVIQTDNLAELIEQINILMSSKNENWQPVGGICILYCPINGVSGTMHFRYSQAMIKS